MSKRKFGRGIEISVEALVEILHQRFPTMADWDTLSNMVPQVSVDPQMGIVGLYFVGRGEPPIEGESAFPLRRIAERAPVPSTVIATPHLLTPAGVPRCGYQHSNGEQCRLRNGHTDSLDPSKHDAGGE